MAKVLVIDDDTYVTQILHEFLTGEGLEVEVVHQAEEGFEQALKAPSPDLIMLDVNLPDATGFQIIGRFRQDARTKSIPVIMMTGAARFPNQQAIGKSMGANEYVLKPFDVDDVGRKVTALLGIKMPQKPVTPPAAAPALPVDPAPSATAAMEPPPPVPVANGVHPIDPLPTFEAPLPAMTIPVTSEPLAPLSMPAPESLPPLTPMPGLSGPGPSLASALAALPADIPTVEPLAPMLEAPTLPEPPVVPIVPAAPPAPEPITFTAPVMEPLAPPASAPAPAPSAPPVRPTLRGHDMEPPAAIPLPSLHKAPPEPPRLFSSSAYVEPVHPPAIEPDPIQPRHMPKPAAAPTPVAALPMSLDAPGPRQRKLSALALGVMTLQIILASVGAGLSPNDRTGVLQAASYAFGGWAMMVGLVAFAATGLRISVTAGQMVRIVGLAGLPVVLRSLISMLALASPSLQAVPGTIAVQVAPAPFYWSRPLDLYEIVALVILGLSLRKQTSATTKSAIIVATLAGLGWVLAGRGFFRPF